MGLQTGYTFLLSVFNLNGKKFILQTENTIVLSTEGGFGGNDDEDILGGDEEGGGWDVGDEDLELPPDLVS